MAASAKQNEETVSAQCLEEFVIWLCGRWYAVRFFILLLLLSLFSHSAWLCSLHAALWTETAHVRVIESFVCVVCCILHVYLVWEYISFSFHRCERDWQQMNLLHWLIVWYLDIKTEKILFADVSGSINRFDFFSCSWNANDTHGRHRKSRSHCGVVSIICERTYKKKNVRSTFCDDDKKRVLATSQMLIIINFWCALMMLSFAFVVSTTRFDSHNYRIWINVQDFRGVAANAACTMLLLWPIRRQSLALELEILRTSRNKICGTRLVDHIPITQKTNLICLIGMRQQKTK